MPIWAFVPLVHLTIKTGIKKSALRLCSHVITACWTSASVLNRWLNVETERREVQYLPPKSLQKIVSNCGCMRSSIVVQQQDACREQSRVFTVNCLSLLTQRSTISGSIYGCPMSIEINQYYALMVSKNCGHNSLCRLRCFAFLTRGDEGYLFHHR